MEPQQILDLYSWEQGLCFRHPANGAMPTTVVRELHPRSGSTETVRACRACVLVMEGERRHLAQQLGYDYEPGHAGGPFP